MHPSPLLGLRVRGTMCGVRLFGRNDAQHVAVRSTSVPGSGMPRSSWFHSASVRAHVYIASAHTQCEGAVVRNPDLRARHVQSCVRMYTCSHLDKTAMRIGSCVQFVAGSAPVRQTLLHEPTEESGTPIAYSRRGLLVQTLSRQWCMRKGRMHLGERSRQDGPLHGMGIGPCTSTMI